MVSLASKNISMIDMGLVTIIKDQTEQLGMFYEDNDLM